MDKAKGTARNVAGDVKSFSGSPGATRMGMRHCTGGAGLRFPEHPLGNRINEYAILSGRNFMERATAHPNHRCISSEDVQEGGLWT